MFSHVLLLLMVVLVGCLLLSPLLLPLLLSRNGQSQTVDLPYKSWSMRPIGPNLALLTLEVREVAMV